MNYALNMTDKFEVDMFGDQFTSSNISFNNMEKITKEFKQIFQVSLQIRNDKL